MKQVVILLGAGSIGQAIARRVSAGKHLVLADYKLENAQTAAKILEDAGFECSTVQTDLSSRPSIMNMIAHAQSSVRLLISSMPQAYHPRRHQWMSF
jgi:NAD(P)-dependent dehydrogenase (short-subunit alcohol dehydrogenase family)